MLVTSLVSPMSEKPSINQVTVKQDLTDLIKPPSSRLLCSPFAVHKKLHFN